MSDATTVNGATVPNNYSTAFAAFGSFFNSSVTATIFGGSGDATVPSGPVGIGSPNTTTTITGATAVADTSAGGNSITTAGNTAVFAAPNDTVTASTGSTTLYGAHSQVNFNLGGNGSVVYGDGGAIVGSASGTNDTLIGGSSISLFSVTGSNSLVVAGISGITGADLANSTGPETIATNPLGGNGKLVAILGSGADTVLGGGGASTITAGSGNDVFAFIHGHAGGSEVIIGFNAKDNLGFAGYGYTGSNLPTENVTALGDVITLSDGTTITLAGIDHKIF